MELQDNSKIILTSECNGSLSVNIPDLRYKREWERKGAKKPIDWATLKEAIYDPGFEYMIKEGLLVIESKEALIELGFLEEGQEESKVIAAPLSEAKLKRMSTVMPLSDFKLEIKNLSYEQLQALADYMIANSCADIAKAEIIKDIIGVDIMKSIQLNRD